VPFDLFCLGLLLFFAIRGAFRGFVRQLFGLLGLVGGILLARLAAPAFGEAFGADIHVAPAIATAGLAAVLFICAEILAHVTGKSVHKQLGGGVAGGLNRIGGAFLGVSKGFLAVWAVASLVALVRPHLKNVERNTPASKLQLGDSYAIDVASKSNLITQLREGTLHDDAETVRKKLGVR
jgi:membrane protein required for colicin V production